MEEQTVHGTEPEQYARALETVRLLRRRVEDLQRARSEPLAVVGIGCRLPGAGGGPQALWDLLTAGREGVGPVPADRWDPDSVDPDHPLHGVRRGGFLEGVDEFDPYFFGISPREARRMDPQQRLFLEVAWEAIEDAGLPAESLRGSATGVFVGANSGDYLQLQLADGGVPDLYTTSGGASCIIPNRLSYLMDLRGPSICVDTACSSSLTALHLAGQSLRTGESDLAVVAGMNVVLSPQVTAAHALGLPLAPDGRCKPFDESANGYVRAEGVVVLVLRRLGDALAASDRIWAVVKGSAVNQDGLTNGLTAPNGDAQRAAVEAALRAAGVGAGDVSLLEAHGTGTSLGDPIEVEALDAVYGRVEGPTCFLGSVKSNLGHLEAGAGLVGVLKAVLCLHHRRIVPTLHVTEVNPLLDLAGSRISVARTGAAWDAPDERRHAAVSSFGAGGSNAHVVLGPAPEPAPPQAQAPVDPGQRLLLLTARSAAALEPLARTTAARLRALAPDERFDDVVFTAARRRSLHDHRLAVVASSAAGAAEALQAWAEGEERFGTAAGTALSSRGERRPVFVVPGQAVSPAGAAAGLMHGSPAFAEAARQAQAAVHAAGGPDVLDLLVSGDGDDPGRIDVVQPALFVLAVGLAARLRELGVTPRAVIGHSLGEAAAAYLCGALDLADAARVITVRSSALHRLSGRGGMLLLGTTWAEAEAVAGGEAGVCVAAGNGPSATVLSGDPAALERIEARMRDRNVFARRVRVDVASHSAQVEALLPDVIVALSGLRPRPGAVPMMSTVSAGPVDGTGLDAGYWAENLRRPVRFYEAVQALVAQGADAFVELGPHPVLTVAAEAALAEAGRPGPVLACLHRDRPGLRPGAEEVAALVAHGVTADLGTLVPRDGRVVSLPSYPWARERLWFTDRAPVRPQARPAEPAVASVPVPVRAPASAPVPAPASPADGPVPVGPVGVDAMAGLVRDAVAEVLGFAADRLDPTAGFFQLGMDSMTANRVRVLLAARTGRAIPATALFEHPTVQRLAVRLAASHPGGPANGQPAVRPQEPPADPARDPDGDRAAEPPPATPTGSAGPPVRDVEELTEEELLDVLAAELHRSSPATGSRS